MFSSPQSLTLLLLVAVFAVFLSAHEAEDAPEERGGKLFPLFNVVSFPNDACAGSSPTRNGTCYTDKECSNRGGVSSGTCASGYGVCCIFSLGCGATSSENCTYLAQTNINTVSPNPCTYTICRSAANVCRIRFDFASHTLASPTEGLTEDPTAAAAITNGAAIGDCQTDTFSITSPGGVGSPVICGFNDGQHMIVDASDECNMATFNLGSSTTTTRTWNIKVTQYECGTNNRGGDDGCLQYFMGTSGTISSFNFPTNVNVVGASTTHLSNQRYDICIRQEATYCGICYTPARVTMAGDTPAASATNQASFGLSVNTADGDGVALQNTDCSSDFIVIPGAQSKTGFAIGTVVNTVERLCGRVLDVQSGKTIANAVSVCTQQTPFRISVVTDADEVRSTAAMSQLDEGDTFPGGIVGFSLNYQQVLCT